MRRIDGFHEMSPVINLKKMNEIASAQPIDTAEAAIRSIGERVSDLAQECIYALYVDVSMRPICCSLIGKGTSVKCPLDIRSVIVNGLLNNAFGVILIHNHPDIGQLLGPSDEDFAVTDQLRSILDIVNIELIDSLVVGRDPANREQIAAFSICHSEEV